MTGINVTTLLFDLGGVLIELGPVAELMASSPFDDEDIWRNWTRSPSVRRFESGRCTEDEFAHSMIEEFRLSVSPADFLERFNAWPRGVFDGAESLLDSLSGKYRLACLSNTNPTHYDGFLRHQALLHRFEATFFSHVTGVLKPEPDAFAKVLHGLGVAPGDVLFFDDNAGNIEAARLAGLHAEQVNTPDDVVNRLNGLGLPT